MQPTDKPKDVQCKPASRLCQFCAKPLVRVGIRRKGGKLGRKDGPWRTLHVACARAKYKHGK
eukprot:3645982-Prymnesium_polylepis.1